MAEFLKSLGNDAQRPYEIEWDEDPVRVKWTNGRNETGSVSFPWSDVSTVDTFKRDYFTVDCICLAFETPDGWFEVNEEYERLG